MSEDKRLKALESSQARLILTHAAKAQFGRIVRLAASTLNVGVALITIVDSDKTWHVVRHGTDILDIPRAQSFCNEAIKFTNQVMVVANAQADERYAKFPLVNNEPKVMFYAGTPLITKDGYAVGTLCVMDTVPHSDFLGNEKQIILDLASTVMVQLEAIAQEHVNDDLNIVNKALQSVNDGLSTENDNLSTANDGLQTVNDGLSIVNDDLIIVNDDLIIVNDDLSIVNEELQHRMGNMYAHVSALVSMMSNTSVSKALFTKRLRSKISVLAETQALLAARNWTSVPISQLVDTALAPFRNSSEDKRIRVKLAEDFLVSPRGVFILTLMLNELGTNAVKHGALKTMNGQVNFACENNGKLRFTWKETVTSGLPSTDNPDGFGTQILEQIVPLDLHGSAEHELSPTGLMYQVTAEASRICVH